MDFKLNRNNKILEVNLSKYQKWNGEEEIRLGTVELNQTYIADMEKILTGKKEPGDDTYLMIDKMQIPEKYCNYLELNQEYEMKASALSLSGQNIYCFDLFFDRLVLDRIGTKKRNGGDMILKNVKFKYAADGKYTATEVSGIMNQETANMEVSVVTGDKVAAVKL